MSSGVKFWCLKFDLQLKKKRSANISSTGKQNNASAGSNDDTIRAAILDEATIVCISRFMFNSK